jgi:hypothetical protein
MRDRLLQLLQARRVHAQVQPDPEQLGLAASDAVGQLRGVIGGGLGRRVEQPALLGVGAAVGFQPRPLPAQPACRGLRATALSPARGGKRTVNTALHMAAVTQTRGLGPGMAYVDKLLSEGKTRTEALRLLRRRLSDRVFSGLLTHECEYQQPATVTAIGRPEHTCRRRLDIGASGRPARQDGSAHVRSIGPGRGRRVRRNACRLFEVKWD